MSSKIYPNVSSRPSVSPRPSASPPGGDAYPPQIRSSSSEKRTMSDGSPRPSLSPRSLSLTSRPISPRPKSFSPFAPKEFEQEFSTCSACDSCACSTENDRAYLDHDRSLAIFGLPWYRFAIPSINIACLHEPDSNYTPYMIFCLRTRISETISSVLGNDSILTFTSTYANEKMQLNLVINRYTNNLTEVESNIGFTDPNSDPNSEPYSENNFNNPNLNSTYQIMSCSPEQRKIIENKINEILTNYPEACLLMNWNLQIYSESGQTIPKEWIQQILPFVDLDSKYQPFYTNDGYHIILSDWDQLQRGIDDTNTSQPSDIVKSYLQMYSTLYMKVVNTIKKMYDDGYVLIISPNTTLLQDWSLIPVDEDGILYKPNWKDTRITRNLVEFITNLIQNQNTIRLHIGRDDTQRHFIAKILTSNSIQFSFMGSYIKIQAINISHVKRVCTLIDSAKAQKDQIGILKLKETFDPTFYLNEDCIKYQTHNLLRPYTISCLEKI